METTKKFWCHYIGNDGNTPKRRSIELKNIADLIPAIGDNMNCQTPIWYDEYDDEHIETYVQLSDSVAVSTLIMGVIRNTEVKIMQMTDDDIKAEGQQRLKEHLECRKDLTPEQIEREKDYFTKDFVENLRQNRDHYLDKLVQYKNYTDMLLDGSWISCSTVRAYEEVGSPYLPVIQHLRNVAMEERRRKEEERKEEARKREEEEARRKAEAETREKERLTQEAEKLKNGESISGEDVVTLCRLYGIDIHLRTVHNLQQVITEIDGKGKCYYRKSAGKRAPQLDGCFKTASELYNYLQTH